METQPAIDKTTGEILEDQDKPAVLGPPEFSKSVANIIPALCQARLAMADIVFNGWNKDQGYSFRKAVDICAATGPALAENGIMVFPSVLDTDESQFTTINQKKMVLTAVTMAIKMMHSSGEFVTQSFKGTALDTGDKGIFKAYTSCMKYHLLLTFLLGGEDVENDQSGEGSNSGSGRQQSGRQGSGSRSGKPPVKTATITPVQAENLKDLINISGWKEKQVLDYYRIGKLENLPVVKYDAACKFLQKAIDKKRITDETPSTGQSLSENGGNVPSETTTGAQLEPFQQPPAVSLDQVQKLQELIKETGTDEAKFMVYLNVETLAHLSATRFDEAVKALEAKKKKNGGQVENGINGAVNQLVATLSARNIDVKVDEATGNVQATPGYQDSQAKAFLKSLGFVPMIGGKSFIKVAK